MRSGTNSLEIGLFGRLRVESNGEVVAIAGERQQRLLARLALAQGTPISRGTLAGAVWGGQDGPIDADTPLRTYVARLRRSMGDHADAIETTEGGYRLAESVTTDLDRFDSHVSRGRALAETGEAERAINELTAALQLSREALLSPWSDEPWVFGEANRTTEASLAAAGLRAELHTELGYHDAAVEDLTPLNARHPHHEGIARRLAAAMYAQGRSGDALAVVAECRRRLATDLGLDPAPELVELEASILDHRPRATPTQRQLRSYQLGERIGEGSFSIVYRGHQPSVAREVAIKVIRAELANQADFVRRFETEAQLVARLEHPHIVPLYDFWREPDAAYLVMRWLRGGTLHSRLSERTLTPEETEAMVTQIGDALALAHAQGVIHRDVKPANVFLDEAGRFYLGDFGIAVDSQYGPDPVAALSLGSPAYASPEQLGRREVSPATDVYGLAVTAYEALCGQLPFADAASQAELVRRQLDEEFPQLTSVVAGLPAELDDVMAAATAKDPAQRTGSVAEFVTQFQAALTGGSRPTSPRITIGTATLVGDGLCPYIGLAAFGEGDTDRFFGRDRITTLLLERLRDTRMVMVVGPSGSGKSSLVRAGVIPRIRSGALPGSDEWFVVTMTPGADPYEELEAALLRVAVNPPASLREQLLVDDRGIARSVRRILPDGDAELLLVLDQFEELFTLCENEATRRSFLQALITAVEDDRARLRVVATIRADYYDRPLRHPELAQVMRDGTVPITPLAPDELERAIVDPAARAGVEFEPGLVPTMVAAVNDQPGALPLLQFTLTRLWDRQVSGVLTMDSYEELGGVSGSLAAEAEALYLSLGEAAQSAARAVFQRLVTPGEGRGDTRRRAMQTEILDLPHAEEVIDAFGRARLLAFDRDHETRNPTVEVGHEALLREWPRLAAWVDEDRDGLRIHRHLTAAARGWADRGGDVGEFYRGGRLEAAAEYAERATLTADEQTFLDASVAATAAAAAGERRRVRRLRGLATATAVIAVLALIATVIAVGQQRRADDNAAAAEASSALASQEAERANDSAAEAQAALADAEIATLISRSAVLVDENPAASLLLAVEAYDREQSNRSTGALATALSARVGETLRIDLEPIPHVHCEEGADSHNSYLPPSNDGWVGFHRAGEVTAIDPTSGEIRPHTTLVHPCAGVSLSHIDGPVVQEFGGEILVERVPGSGELSTLMTGVPVFWGALTARGADGTILAVTGETPAEADFHLFGPDDRAIAAPLVIDIEIGFMELSGSGRFALAGTRTVNELQETTLQLVDATTGDGLWQTEIATQLTSTAFNPSDSLVAVSDQAGTVTLLDLETGIVTGVIAPGAGAIPSVSFLDDQRLALATRAGVEVWNVAGPSVERQIPLNGAEAVRAIDDQRLTVVTRGHGEMVVLDLTQSGLAELIEQLPPGTRTFIDAEGVAGLGIIGAAEGQLLDLITGERRVYPLGVDDAGLVVGISPHRSLEIYTAFSIDGVLARFVDGVEAAQLRLNEDPGVSIRQASGHRTPDDRSRVAVYLSDLDDVDSGRVFLIDLDDLEVILEVGRVADCQCGGIVPSPDGTQIVIDTGEEIVLHAADGSSRTIEVTPLALPNLVNHAAHPSANRLLRATSTGLVEMVDLDSGVTTPVDDFGTAVDNVSFVGTDRATVVTDAGEVWVLDLRTGERIGLVWRGGSGDDSSGSPVVSQDGSVLWVPTSSELVAVPLDPVVWRERACQLAGRNLSDAEWAVLVPGATEPRPICAR